MPNVTVSESGAFGGCLVMRMEPSQMELVFFQERPPRVPRAFRHVRTQQEVSSPQPRRRPSPEPYHAGTVILDVQPLEP